MVRKPLQERTAEKEKVRTKRKQRKHNWKGIIAGYEGVKL